MYKSWSVSRWPTQVSQGLKGFKVSSELPVVITEGVQQPHILVCAGHAESGGREDAREDVVGAGTNSLGP